MMPRTFMGMGTKFYGQEETKEKDAYIATKWIVFFYLPIVPIGSFKCQRAEEISNVISNSFQGNAVKRAAFQWRHVCNVYAFYLAIAILAHLVTSRQTNLANKALAPPETSNESSNSEAPSPRIPVKPAYERPTTTEDGTPFPIVSGYIQGYEQAFTDGKTRLTVDNEQNNYDIYIKLYNLDVTPPERASVLFIKRNEKFTIEQIRAGNYELRYRNLDNGNIFRTDALVLEEVIDQSSVVNFTDLTVELYGSIGGEMEIYPITEEDFED